MGFKLCGFCAPTIYMDLVTQANVPCCCSGARRQGTVMIGLGHQKGADPQKVGAILGLMWGFGY